MAATVRASYYGASATEPAGATAESGIVFNREDTQTGTSNPIPIPTATGTNYPWYKQLALEVTGGTTNTTLNNFTVKYSGSLTTGLTLDWKAASTYVQAASGNKPTDDASNNDAVPTGYTAMSATAAQFDGTTNYDTSVSGNGRASNFCLVICGVGFNYTSGAGSSISLPDIILSYDEA